MLGLCLLVVAPCLLSKYLSNSVEGKEKTKLLIVKTSPIFMYGGINEMSGPWLSDGWCVVAAALSTLNSGLNYVFGCGTRYLQALVRSSQGEQDDFHYVKAGRVGMAVAAVALGSMGILCVTTGSNTPTCHYYHLH
ncbi:hypothetical protein O9929_03015 [Vibrio lentus]|nr:hypothetical protein [Vibrio lentus]